VTASRSTRGTRATSLARSPIGDPFTSFDEAWAHFLARREPLESFHAALPEDENETVDVWLAVPREPVKAAAAEVQRSFAILRPWTVLDRFKLGCHRMEPPEWRRRRERGVATTRDRALPPPSCKVQPCPRSSTRRSGF
jgi:hypothetical protein